MDKYDPRHTPSQEELDDVNAHWDEQGRDYDSNRGDHVDHLNDTTPPPRPVAQKRPPRKKGGLLVLFLVLFIAGGGWTYFSTHKTTTPTPTTSTPKTSTPATVKTKHYSSGIYNLALDYPTTWRLSAGDTALTITSPQTTLKAADGDDVEGYIQLSVQNRQDSLPEFAKGSALSIANSEKVTYKNPTTNQRSYSYITFTSYATTVGNGWDAIYLTGGNQYTANQYMPMSDIIQTDPLVSVKFLKCEDQICSGAPTPYTLNFSQWKDKNFSTPIKTIVQSFSFN